LNKIRTGKPRAEEEVNDTPLQERLFKTNVIQAKRFSKLKGNALEIATEGLNRSFKAWDRLGVNPDSKAIGEIIDDALRYRRVYTELGGSQEAK
jgi:hypothetical protein